MPLSRLLSRAKRDYRVYLNLIKEPCYSHRTTHASHSLPMENAETIQKTEAWNNFWSNLSMLSITRVAAAAAVKRLRCDESRDWCDVCGAYRTRISHTWGLWFFRSLLWIWPEFQKLYISSDSLSLRRRMHDGSEERFYLIWDFLSIFPHSLLIFFHLVYIRLLASSYTRCVCLWIIISTHMCGKLLLLEIDRSTEKKRSMEDYLRINNSFINIFVILSMLSILNYTKMKMENLCYALP